MSKARPLHQTTNIFFNDINIDKLFLYNQFSEDIEYLKAPEWDGSVEAGKMLDDDDLTNIRYYMTNVHNLEPTKGIVGEACFIVARRNPYHPVKEYIQKESWDGVARIDEWIIKATGCVDNILNRQIGAKFLIAAVNRVYNPGCKFDHMVILEGDQGIGKSTLVEELAGQWYLDTNFDSKDKDLVDCMRKAFIIEISELSGMNKKDVNWLKSFITKKVDRVRLPYAERAKDFRRKSIFIGTYNPSGNNTYMNDDTGNRRFWPVECKRIDIAYVKQVKHQLWAEAYERRSEQLYISQQEAIDLLKGMHQDRELEGPAFLKIQRYLQDNAVTSEIGINELLESALKINTDGKDPRELMSHWTIIGMAMRKLGWRKGTNTKRHTYFKDADENPEEPSEVRWEE